MTPCTCDRTQCLTYLAVQPFNETHFKQACFLPSAQDIADEKGVGTSRVRGQPGLNSLLDAKVTVGICVECHVDSLTSLGASSTEYVWKPTTSLKKMVTQSTDSGSTGRPSFNAAETCTTANPLFKSCHPLHAEMLRQYPV